MSWIVIYRQCDSCGGDVQFQIFDSQPTSEEVSELVTGSCGNTYVTEIEEGINFIENKNY